MLPRFPQNSSYDHGYRRGYADANWGSASGSSDGGGGGGGGGDGSGCLWVILLFVMGGIWTALNEKPRPALPPPDKSRQDKIDAGDLSEFIKAGDSMSTDSG